MCPACMATTAMLIASAVSAGGVTAVLANKLRAFSWMSGERGHRKDFVESTNQEEETWDKQRTSK
jgi:hypothetical protein